MEADLLLSRRSAVALVAVRLALAPAAPERRPSSDRGAQWQRRDSPGRLPSTLRRVPCMPATVHTTPWMMRPELQRPAAPQQYMPPGARRNSCFRRSHRTPTDRCSMWCRRRPWLPMGPPQPVETPNIMESPHVMGSWPTAAWSHPMGSPQPIGTAAAHWITTTHGIAANGVPAKLLISKPHRLAASGRIAAACGNASTHADAMTLVAQRTRRPPTKHGGRPGGVGGERE